MYVIINKCYPTIISDEDWRDYYRKNAKTISLSGTYDGLAHVYFGSFAIYLPGNPFGYGGNDQIDIQERSFGKWNQSRIVKIGNTRIDYDLYFDDETYIVRVGNISIKYRNIPGTGNYVFDTIGGNKIELDSGSERIKKFGNCNL